MIYETIRYTEDGRVHLQTYVPELFSIKGNALPAMIVLPGGAWTHLSENESEAVALTYVREGFASFVLNYSVGDYSAFPNPLIEVAWAIATIRQNAQKWHIDPNKIALVGFSAGASLAAISATQWIDPIISETLGIPKENYKANAAILAYGCYDLATIFDNQEDDLVIPKPGKITADRTPQVDVVNYVTKDTAPIFIYHCRYDEYVPVKNTWLLAEKLEENKLPFEMHIFQSGHHGMSVNNELTVGKEPIDPSVTQWVNLSIQWLKELFQK